MEEKVNKGTSEKGEVRNEKEGRVKGRKGRRRVRGRKKRIHDGKERKITPQFQPGYFKMQCLTMLRATESYTRCLWENLAGHIMCFLGMYTSQPSRNSC